MTGSGFGKLSTARLLIAAAVIAIVSGASVGLGVGYVIHYDAPTTRTFYLFDRSLPFNETVFNIPHDTWVPDTITVNKGDHVLIQIMFSFISWTLRALRKDILTRWICRTRLTQSFTRTKLREAVSPEHSPMWAVS